MGHTAAAMMHHFSEEWGRQVNGVVGDLGALGWLQR